MQIQCLACGHDDEVADDGSPDFFDRGIFRCSECGARMAYGKLSPRLVEEPFVDAQGNLYLRIKIQDPVTKQDLYVLDLDPQFAAMHAKNVLSLVLP